MAPKFKKGGHEFKSLLDSTVYTLYIRAPVLFGIFLYSQKRALVVYLYKNK